MKAKITRIVLLLMIATQVMTTFTAEEFVGYENASVTPIHWTRDGTALVLLGLERRKESGEVWCDFFGKRDSEDNNNPLVTAKREALEESANQLRFLENPLHREDTKSTIYFTWETKYIDPQEIRESADKLRAAGKGRHIEKTDWKWVTLEDLLNEKTGLKLHWTLNYRLKKHKAMRSHFEELLTKKRKEKKDKSKSHRKGHKPKHHGSKTP